MNKWVAPAYLLACILLGGSAQGVWQNLVLELTGLAIIGWACWSPMEEGWTRRSRSLLLIVAVGLAVVALQLVPLPISFWNYGIRGRLAGGFAVLGRPSPDLPLSLAPYDSLATLLWLIPPAAMFCATLRLSDERLGWLAAALIAGTLAGVILGALQVAAGAASPWYLYPETNHGFAVGFFANANHMADLLVIALPFLAALAAAGRSRNVQRQSSAFILLGAAALLVLTGIALNRSLAGYGLVGPAILGSALVLIRPSSRSRRWVAGLAVFAGFVAVAGLATSSIGGSKLGEEASTSVQSRATILAITTRATADFMPLGSGLGTFLKVYRLYERPDTVTNEYVIHAHNDYAEIALELGLPGILLMLTFLAWWGAAVFDVWPKDRGGPFARAATIASGAILLHSLVDYPLRTAALAACFAVSLALMAGAARVRPKQDVADLRPTRHLVFP